MKPVRLTWLAVMGILAGGGEGVSLAADPQVASVDETAPAPFYQGSGRRDPFVRPGSAPTANATVCGPRGLAGVRARDLAVKGIVRTAEGFLALLIGPAGESHVARVGDRMCDGIVGSIDPAAVTLERDAAPGDGASQARTIRLRLHAE